MEQPLFTDNPGQISGLLECAGKNTFLNVRFAFSCFYVFVGGSNARFKCLAVVLSNPTKRCGDSGAGV